VNILEPIDQLIVKYQSDSVPLSDVFYDFHQLPSRFSTAPAWELMSQEEQQYLVLLSSKRFKFMYSDAHGLAYLLDPRYLGEGLSHMNRCDLEDMLINLPNGSVEQTEQQKGDLCMQYTEFSISARKEKNNCTIRYKMLADRRKSPLQYWQADGCSWKDLQKIALRVFSMVTSSASSERNFSTFGFVHSKLRNSLGPEKVEKLVFIKTNHPAFSEIATNAEYSDDDNSSDSIPASEEDSEIMEL
jgi:hypothetical protein